jgi:hypothetical protein
MGRWLPPACAGLFLVMMLAGCQAAQDREASRTLSPQDRMLFERMLAAVEHAQTQPATARPAGGVTHVVLVWLKKPGDPDARAALLEAPHQLRTIPGVIDVQTGTALPSTRPVVDSSYDVGMVITFADVHALQSYATHPVHLKLVEEVLKPSADHYKVYDFR